MNNLSEQPKSPEELGVLVAKSEEMKKKLGFNPEKLVENYIELGLINMNDRHYGEKLHGDSVASFVASARKYEAPRNKATYPLKSFEETAYLGDAPPNEIIACCTVATMIKMMIIAEDYANEGREDESYALLRHAFFYFHEGNKIKHKYNSPKVKESDVRKIYLTVGNRATAYAKNLLDKNTPGAKVIAKKFLDFAKECEESLRQIKEL